MKDFHFYRNLKPISDFKLLAKVDSYQPFPPSWQLVVSDVLDSTGHIKSGSFKEINMVSASVIAAVSNHLKPIDVPFTFAGDGSIIAIPADFSEEVQAIIETCKAIAWERFDIQLAVGIVPVEELYRQGYDLSVAKVYTSEKITQAAFRGEGVFRAEEMIKKQSAPVIPQHRVEVDLSGLECRWNYFPARREAVALIVLALEKDPEKQSEIYLKILNQVQKIYGDEIELKPIRQQDMKLSASPHSLMAEIKIRSKNNFVSRVKYGLKLLYMQAVGHLLMNVGFRTRNTNWGEYKSDFIKNSDYRKFSGDLKMIVTGSPEQKEKLNYYLEDLYQQKKIIFGLHVSTATITTCYISDYQDNHIHFIDGADGGYTMASIDFKKRANHIIS